MKSKPIECTQKTQLAGWVKTTVQVLLGTLYVALLSHVNIPLKPIPVSMQTFAIFTLALSQGSRKSCYSLLLYLFAATMGLPVLSSGYINPLWFLDASAGYCVSFPLAAYIIGKMTEIKNRPSTVWMFAGLCLGQFVVYLLGVAYLSSFVGLKQALMVGFYPFVLFDGVKLVAALATKKSAGYAAPYLRLVLKNSGF